MSEVSGFIGKVIEELRQEDTISIIHTGPVPMAELERLDAIPKFYFFVINDHEDGVIEHQFLTKIVGAQIQTEIVKLPIKVVEYILKKGYRDMPSFKILEGLKFGTAIFDTDGEGERIVKTAKENLSISRFVGDLVHITKATFDDARTLHENEEYENAILVSR
ncbi:MAG: hypothetical protein KAT70_03220, partial [Thermoplasmata archaeon]|nr:hypothetical protein [Thermoplasmata archaeon]